MWRTLLSALATRDDSSVSTRHNVNFGFRISYLHTKSDYDCFTRSLLHPINNHHDRALGCKRGTFLPADNMTAVVSGKVDAIVRNDEFPVRPRVISRIFSRRIAGPAADPRPQVIRHLTPAHVARLLQFLALAGMQFFNCRSGSGELRFV